MTDKQIDPREIFSSSSWRYLASADHQSGPDLEVVRQVASDLCPPLTLDVAAGAGHALVAAAPHSGTCVALDLTLEMLQVARKHLAGAGVRNAYFVQSEARRLPLSDGSVFLLTCRIAPHHFKSVTEFLLDARRVLNADGRCVIIDSVVPGDPQCDRFLNEVERLRDPSHIRSHTFAQWLDLIKRSGWTVISAHIFERSHPFREWAGRTGLSEEEVVNLGRLFMRAPEKIRRQFKVQPDEQGQVASYTDEKGIFVLKREKG